MLQRKGSQNIIDQIKGVSEDSNIPHPRIFELLDCSLCSAY